MVDTGMGAGIVLEKAKGKTTISASQCQAFKKEQGAVSLERFFLATFLTHFQCDNCWADNDPEVC